MVCVCDGAVNQFINVLQLVECLESIYFISVQPQICMQAKLSHSRKHYTEIEIANPHHYPTHLTFANTQNYIYTNITHDTIEADWVQHISATVSLFVFLFSIFRHMGF